MSQRPKKKMSAEAIARLEAELSDLETIQRPAIIERIKAARELGDLSENADYHAAREEQARIESKIKELTARLKNVEVGEVVDDGVVAAGKVVTFRHSGAGLKTYLFGEREEATEELAVLSSSSPIGVAIEGLKAGSVVKIDSQNGEVVEIEIIEVRAR